MPRPPIDLHLMVRQILQHTTTLHPEADRPIRHFERSTNGAVSMLEYIDDHIEPADVYAAVYNRYLGHLRRMVLAEVIESFERFLKELASICIDFLAQFVTDDRLEVFVPKRGDKIAAFFNATSIGRALCESDTWINNASINSRFASLLKDPAGADWEHLFPQANQNPAAERPRAATLAILWQIRHNLAHNIGVITQSDAMKFRVLIGGAVDADRLLFPTDNDLKYAKRFLSETAARTNERVGLRLAQLLDRHCGKHTTSRADRHADATRRWLMRQVCLRSHIARGGRCVLRALAYDANLRRCVPPKRARLHAPR